MSGLNLYGIARWAGRNLTTLVAAFIITGILGSALVMLRYDLEVVEAGNYPHAFVLDRWNGDVYYVNSYGRFPVERKAYPPKPPS